MGRGQRPSAHPAAQLLRSNLVELRPSYISPRLRERAISRSDIIIIIIIIIKVTSHLRGCPSGKKFVLALVSIKS